MQHSTRVGLKILTNLKSLSKWLGVFLFSAIFLTACGGGKGEGNELLEEGSLGIEMSAVSGDNQIHARRQIYSQPLRIKIVSSDGGVSVPDFVVNIREVTSTGATFPSTARTDGSGFAQIDVRSPNLYSATVVLEFSGRGVTGKPQFTLTTIPDTVTFIDYGPTNLPPAVHMADDITPITPFEVQLKDSYGFLIDTNSTDNVTISRPTGTGALGGTLTRQVSGGIATFNDLTYQTLEPVVLRATHVPFGLTVDHNMQVVNGKAFLLAYTTQPNASYVAGVPIEPVLELRDKFGNLVTYGADATAPVTLTINSGTGVIGGTSTANVNSGIINFTGLGMFIDLVGTKTLRATKAATTGFGDTGVLTQNSNSFTITPAPADRLSMVGGTNLVAGTCNSYVVTSRDPYTNLSPVTSNKVLSLVETGSGLFYSDAGCTTNITSVNFPSGSDTTTIYYRDTVAPEANDLTVDDGAGGLTPVVQAVTVRPGPPSQFVVSGPSFLVSGRCSTAYTVSSRDQFGNLSNVAGSTAVTLAGGNGVFYSDASCSSVITGITLAGGTNSGTVYFKDDRGETINIIADDGAGGLNPSAYSVGVSPDRLIITGSSPIFSGTCSTYNIISRDSTNVAANAINNITVNLSEVGNGNFYSDAACTAAIASSTITAGSSTSVIYFKDDFAQAASLIADDAAAILTSGSIAVTVKPDHFIITGNNAIVTNVCSPAYTYTIKDTANNSVNADANMTVTLSGQGNGFFYSDNACTTLVPGNSQTILAGTNSGTFYFKDAMNEGVSLTVDDGAGGMIAGVLNVSVGPDRLLISGPSQIRAEECGSYTVTSSDPSLNPATVAFSTAVNLTGKANGAFFSNAACTVPLAGDQITIAAGQSAAGFFYKNATAELLTLNADDTGSLTAGTRAVAVGPNNFLISGAATLKSGTCSAAYTVTTRDANNTTAAVLNNTTVTMTGKSNGLFYSDATCATGLTADQFTIAAGSSTGTFYYRNSVGEAITFNADDGAGGLTAATFALSLGPSQLFISGSASVKSNTCSAVFTFVSRDAAGNTDPVLVNTSLNFTDGSATGTFYSDATCSTATTTGSIAAGASSGTIYFKDTTAATRTLTVADAAATLNSSSANVAVGPDRLVIIGNVATSAGLCEPYGIRSRDTDGNNANVLVNTTINVDDGAGSGVFYSDAACTTSIASTSIAAGAGLVTVYYKDMTAESVVLRATDAASYLATGTLNVSTGPDRLIIAGPTSSKSGVCLSYSVTTTDPLGNPSNAVSNVTVNLTDGAAAGAFFSDNVCSAGITSTTILAGSNTKAVYYRDNKAESVTLNADDASAFLTSDSHVVNIGPDKITLAGASSYKSGTCQTYTLTYRDTNNTAAGVLAATQVNVDDGAASGTFYSDASCSTSITFVSPGAGVSTNTLYYRNNVAESATLTFADNASVLASATLNITVGPDHLTVAGNTSFKSGTCQAYTINSRDTANNTANVLSLTTLNLTDGAATGVYYSDVGCTASITSTTIASGANAATVYYKTAIAEALTLTVADAAASLTSATLAVSAGPDHLRISGTSAPVSGVCATYTVESLDASNNVANALANITVNLSDTTATGQFYSDNTCATVVATRTISSGGSSATFYYRDAVAESVTLTAADNAASLASGTIALTVSPDRIILTGNSTFKSGTCQAYTATTRDAAGNAANVLANTTINLSQGAALGAFYSDNTCATSTASATVTSGTNNVVFYYRNNTAQAITITAADGGAVLTTGTLAVTAGPDRIIIAGNATFGAGSCEPYTVRTRDAAGNFANVLAATTINLTDGAASGVFYSDNTCATSTTSTSIASGSNTASIYYKDVVAENITLSAADAAANLTTGTLNVSAGPDRLTIAGNASFKSGTCQTYTVTSRDGTNAAANVLSNTTINLDDGAASGTFYSNNTCATSTATASLSTGSSSVIVYYRDNVGESITLSAADNAAFLTTGTLAVIGGPSALTVAGNTSFNSGTCQAYVITTKDAAANTNAVLANTTVDLTDGAALGSYFSDNTCATGITQKVITSGTSTTTIYYRNATAETATLNFADAAANLSSTSTNVTSGPDRIIVTGSASFRAGTCQTYTLTTRDAAGNAANVFGATTVNLNDGVASGVFYSDAACGTSITSTSMAAASSTKNVYYKNNVAEAITLTAADNAASLTTGTLNITAGPDRLILAGSSSFKSGTCQAITVTSQDPAANNANVLSNTTVTLTDGAAVGIFYSDAACGTSITQTSIASGANSSTFYYRNNTAESITITAADGASSLATATLNVTSGPDRLFVAGNTSFASGSCQIITVTTRDTAGAVKNALVLTTVNLDDGAASGVFYSNNTCGAVITSTSIASGASSSVVYYRDNTAQNATLSAVDNAANLATGTLAVAVGPNNLLISGNASFKSGTCQAYTLTTRDATNTTSNVLANTTVNVNDGAAAGLFYSDNTCATSATSAVVLSGTSSIVVYYKNNVAEAITLNADDAASVLTSASLNVTSGPDRLILAGSATVKAGICEPYTITSRDAATNTKNVLAATTIDLADGAASGGFFSDVACGTSITQTSIAAGSSSRIVYYKNNVGENATLTATDNPANLTAASLNIATSPDRLTIAGTSSFKSGTCQTYTITSRDAANNARNVVSATTVNVGDGAGSGVFYSDNTCATSATSTSIASGANTATVYYKNDVAEAVTLSAADNAADLTTGTVAITVGPDRIIISASATFNSGSCQAVVATSKDTAGSTKNVLANTTVNFTDGAASGSYYSDNTCATGATSGVITSGTSAVTVYYRNNVAEAITLAAADNAANLAGSSVNVTSGPSAITVTGNASFKSGTCQAYTITTRDAAANTTNVLVATTINLTDGAAAGSYYSDNTCATGTATASIASGSSAATVYYRNNTAQAATLSAADAAASLSTGTLNIASGPDKLILAGNSTFNSGSCQAYTITSQDNAGATANVLANTVIDVADGAASGSFFSDNTCATGVTSRTITSGTSVVTVYYRNNVGESITLTANDNPANLTGASLNITSGPDRLILAGATAAKSGTCQAYTVTAQDASANTRNVLVNTTINLTDGAAAGSYFSNNTCATGTTTASIASGSSSATFYYRTAVAENVTLNAADAAASLTTGTRAVSFGPDRITVAAASSFKSGTCQAVTVTTRDASSNASGVLAITNIDLTDGAASGSFFTDNTCATAGATVTLAAAASSATIYYRNNTAEAVTIAAADNPANLTAGSVGVTVGPDRLRITGTSILVSGTCNSFTLTTRDTNGTTTNALAAVTVNLTDGAASGSFYSDNTCATLITSKVIASGTSTEAIYYKNPVAESTTLTATDNAANLASDSINITDGPNKLTLAGNTTFNAGTCQTYTFTSRDASNNAAPVLANTTVNLSDGVASGTFYSDNTCATSATTTSIPNGSSTAIVYYRNNVAEAATLTGDDAAAVLISATLNVTGGPDRLIVTGTTTIKSGVCAAYTVTSRDPSANTKNVLVATTVNLTDGAASGSFFSDNTCATGAASVSIASGSSSATFYYRDNVAEAVTLTAADNAASLTSGTLNITLGPDRLTIAGATSFKSGTCQTYTVTSRDAGGTAANVLSATTVNLTDGASAGVFYSDNTCATTTASISIASGASAATFYYKDDTAQAITLSAADNAASLTTGTLAVASGPDRIIVAGNSTFKSGTCQTITLTTRDTAANTSNVLSATTINLADGAASGTFYSDNTCATSATTASIASGASSATTYYRNNVAEAITLNASDAAASLTTGTLNVTSGPDRLSLAATSSFKAGTCQAITVTTRDAAGLAKNALVATTVNFTDGAAAGSFFSDNTCVTAATQAVVAAGSSAATIYFKDNTAEAVTVTAADNAADLTSANIALTVGPDRLIITGAATLASGSCQAYTITSRDAAANAANVLAATTVNLTDGAASGVFYSDNVCTSSIATTSIASGSNNSVVYYRNNIAEAATLSAADNAASLTTGTLAITSGPDRLTIAIGSSFKSGTCQAVTVNTRDASSNLTNPLTAVTVNLADGAASGVFYSDNTCATTITQSTISTAVNTITVYYKNSVAEAITVSAADNASALSTGTANTTAGPDRLIIAGTTSSKSGACLTYTVTSRDAAANTANVLALTQVNLADGAASGTFYSDNTCATTATSVNIASGASAATFYYKNNVAEVATLAGTDNAASLTAASFNVTLGPDHFLVAGNTSFKSGTCQTYTVTAKDTANTTANVLSATQVNLTDGAALGVFYSDNTCLTVATSVNIASGASAATFYYRDNTAEAITLNAADNAAVLTVGTLAVTAGPDRLLLAGPVNVSAGACSSVFTVTTKDAAGNTANALAATTVNLTDGVGSGIFYSDNTCATTITTVSIASGVSVASFYYKDNTSESVTITSSDNAANLASSSLSVDVGPDHLEITGPTAFKAGVCSSAYTLTTKDANNNTAAVLSPVTVNLTGNSNGVYYSDNTCATTITSFVYSAGQSTKTFYFKNNTAEAVTLNADDGVSGLTAGTLGVTTGPDRLFLASSSTFKSGTCQSVTVTTRDAAANTANATSAVTVNLTDGAAAGDFHATNACGAVITTTSIALGSNTSTVYYKNNTAEAITLSAADNASNLTTATLNVTTGPDRLILAGATSPKSGVCVPYSVTTQDAAGATRAALAAITINLTDGAAAGTFYSDNVCASSIASSSIASGGTTVTVYYRNNTAESTTLSAADNAASLATGTLAIQTGPDRITLAAATSFKSGTCQAVTLTSRDQAGVAANVLTNTTLNLSDGAASGIFYTTNTCATSTATASIASGSSSATVYYSNNVAEVATLNADDAAAVLASGSQAVTIGPDRFLLAGSTGIKAGACATYTVTSKDAAANTANVLVATTVNLTDGAASGTFYSDNTCATSTATASIASGANTATFYYRDNVAEAITLTATDAAANLTASTLNITTGPDRLVITGATTPKSGVCLAYVVTSRDPGAVAANVLTATTVNLTDGAAAGIFYSDNTCATGTSTVSIASGANNATFYYRDDTAQAVTLSAADNAANLTTGTLAITVGPDRLAISAASTFKAGTCQTVTVTSKDTAGATANVLVATTVNLTDGAASGSYYSDNTCATGITSTSIASGANTATVYYRDNVGEAITLSAADNAATLATGTVNVTAGPDRITIAGSTGFKSGTCQAFTLTTRDAAANARNALVAITVNLTDGAAAGGFYSDNVCGTGITTTSIASGSSTATVYYLDNTAQAVTLSAADNAADLTTGTLAVSVGPDRIAISGSTPFKSGVCQTFTITTQDTALNTANAIAAITVNLTDGAASGSYFSNNTCSTGITTTSIASGANTATVYYLNNVAESLTLSAADNAANLATGTLAVATGPDRLIVTGSGTFLSGTCQAYTITSKDAAANTKNVLANVLVDLTDGAASGSFFSDNTCATGTTQVTITSGTSSIVAYYKDNVAESITITAADNAASLTSGTLNITAGPDHLDLAGPANPLSGTCAAYTVTSRDASNAAANTASAITVNLTDGTAAGSFFSDNTCATGATSVQITAGTNVRTFYYKNNTSEAVTLSAADNATTLASDTHNITVEPDHFVVAGSTSFRAGTCEAYTITTYDAANAVKNTSTLRTVNLNDGAAVGVFYSDNTCATSITSTTITAGSNVRTVYYRNNTAQAATLNADDAGALLASGTLAVSVGPDRLTIGSVTNVKSGTCQVYTINSRDPDNNIANVTVATTVNLDDGAGVGTFYAENTCATVVTSRTIASGASAASVYYKNNSVESVALTAADNASFLSTGTLNITLLPARLTISGNTTFKSGTCQAYSIAARDNSGVAAVVTGNLTVNLSDGVASGTFYSDNTCATSTTTATILSGSSTTTAWYSNNIAEAATLNADDAAASLDSGTLAVTIGPDRLLLAGSNAIKSGVCTAYTITAQDTALNTKNVLSATTVNVDDGAAVGLFYSDNTCATGTTTASIASGTSSTTVYYRNNTAQSVTLSAADNAASLASSTLNITTSPDRIVISGSTPIISGTCASYTINIRDAGNAAANVLVATTVNLTDGTAAGAYYSDNTCATLATSVAYAIGENTKTIYYRDNTAESLTLTATDAAAYLTSGTLNIVTTPDRLTWAGAAAPNADICTSYSVTSRDAASAAATVASNTSIALTGGGSGAFYSDAACTAIITSALISSGTSSTGTFYYKNALGESLTFSADDGPGGMTAGTLAVGVVCDATSFEVALVGGATSVASNSGFNVRLTAKNGASTKTCYVGNHTVAWTMNGTTAGTLDCGETSGAPVASGQTTLNFAAGVASTTDSVAKFKVIQANATITATEGAISGTSSNIAVTVGPVCRIRLRTASTNGGAINSGANIDLNLNSTTPTSFDTAYAAGYDSFGQYNSDVTVAWSGTGVVYPWALTTTNASDTSKVYGVMVGSGTLQADYAGGGGTRTATASYNVSTTNAIGNLTSATTDSATRTQLGSNTVYQSKDWVPTSDAVTAWRTNSGLGWYSEAFSASRGSRAEFPSRAFLVANANGLDIIDGTNNHLFMRFTKGAGRVIDSTYGDVVSASGLNGKVYVSMRDSGATTGTFIVLDFVSNTVTRFGTGGRYTWNGGGIESRNTASAWTLAAASPALPSNVVYRNFARRISGVDYVALGTSLGAALYQNNAGAISIYKDPTAGAVQATHIASDGKIYYTENTSGVHRYDAALPISADWAPSRTYANSASVNVGSRTFNDLSLSEGTSAVSGTSNTLVAATSSGLSVIQEHTAFGSEVSKLYATTGTGSTPFNNFVNFNGTSGAATMTNGNSVNRTTTWEMFFKPNALMNNTTGAQHLFERGNFGTDAYGLRAGTDGRLECYLYDGAALLTTFSTTASWNKGEWVHVACVVQASGANDLRITIYVNGTSQGTAVGIGMRGWRGTTSAVYFGALQGTSQFFNGAIDEFRLSGNVRYIANFAVPTSEFVVDGPTNILHHFDANSGPTATATFGNNATLNAGAWFSTPKLAGTSDVVTGVDVNSNGTSAVAELVCSGSTGAYSQLTNVHTTTTTLNSSAASIDAQSVDIYQSETITDSDLNIGLTSGGLRLHRR